jgi:hypothetical protein
MLRNLLALALFKAESAWPRYRVTLKRLVVLELMLLLGWLALSHLYPEKPSFRLIAIGKVDSKSTRASSTSLKPRSVSMPAQPENSSPQPSAVQPGWRIERLE